MKCSKKGCKQKAEGLGIDNKMYCEEHALNTSYDRGFGYDIFYDKRK